MPGNVPKLVASAEAEWTYWGQSTWNLVTKTKKISHVDDEPTYARYVIEKYCSIGGGNPSEDDIANDLYPWSAVGMSAIMSGSGISKLEFPFSQAHSTWIKAFVKARKQNLPALYHGYRISEPNAVPEVGDLVGYTYASGLSFDQAQAYFDKTGSYQSHTDVVVARRPGEMDVIGANVMDSVTKKTVALTPGGLIADRSHLWFVVLKRHSFWT